MWGRLPSGQQEGSPALLPACSCSALPLPLLPLRFLPPFLLHPSFDMWTDSFECSHRAKQQKQQKDGHRVQSKDNHRLQVLLPSCPFLNRSLIPDSMRSFSLEQGVLPLLLSVQLVFPLLPHLPFLCLSALVLLPAACRLRDSGV